MRSYLTRRRFLAVSAAAGALPILGRRGLAQAKLRVAAIHTSPVENTWNARVHEALNSAAADGEIDYVFSENVAGPDFARAMREYAEQGFPLIWGEAYAVEAEVRQVAAEYPETAFLMGSSGGPSGDNFGVSGTSNYESAYLSGMLAGRMSKTNTFGAVGALPIPEINRLINAFRQGVADVNPDAKFLVGFIGTFFDPPKAREAALAQIDAGADILFGERIGTADGAKERGVLSIGSLGDYTPRYPGTVFANAVWYYRPTIQAAIEDVRAGRPTGRDYTEYSLMKHGGNDIVYTPEGIPSDAIEAMEKARAEFKAGTRDLPIDNSEPT